MATQNDQQSRYTLRAYARARGYGDVTEEQLAAWDQELAAQCAARGIDPHATDAQELITITAGELDQARSQAYVEGYQRAHQDLRKAVVDVQAETRTGHFAGLAPADVLEGVLQIIAVRLASITNEDACEHWGPSDA